MSTHISPSWMSMLIILFLMISIITPEFFANGFGSLCARRGAQEDLTVNRQALELLEEGGALITCSCSYHLGREQFRDLLVSAARQAGRTVRLIATGNPSPDHPVLLAVPETDYLKCFVLQVL